MKIRKIFYMIISVFMMTQFVECTDHFEDVNKNPHVLYSVDFNYIFPGTIYRSMNNLSELNFDYLMTYSRYAVIQAFCGPRQNEGDGFYQRFYVYILRDLEQAEKEYEGLEGFENRLAVVKTWKAYTYYIMACMYGGIAMSDAMLTYENKTSYKYDTEEQAYTQILELLDEAIELYNPQTQFASTDVISPDVVFGAGVNTVKWRKFANSMRLNIGLHVQNLNPVLAETYVRKAMEQEDWLIASNDENVSPQYGTNLNNDESFYYNRLLKPIEERPTEFNATIYPAMNEYFAIYLFTFKDPRMEEYFERSNALGSATDELFAFADTITKPHNCLKNNPGKCPDYDKHQADGLNEFRRDSILVDYTVPYVPHSELVYMPFNWEADFISPTSTERLQDPLLSMPKFAPSYIKKNFLTKDASIPILSFADICFLKAEANILYGVGQKSAEQYYNDGINASFAQYGIATKAADYMKQDGVKWNTNKTGYADRRGLYTVSINGEGGDKNHLEQIYKQHYFAGFGNFLEAWNLERRTRVLCFPPFLASGVSSGVEGANSTYNYSMERFIYPRTEISQNATEYYKAIDNLRAVSPFFREDRWGDNIFTSLGFAKKNPDLETADAKYVGNKRIRFYAGYFSHFYGTTYEEMAAKAVEMTGDNNVTRALVRAFNYRERAVLGTFLPEGAGVDF